MVNPLEKLMNGRNIVFYNAYVKNLISDSGMSVTDITDANAIPQLTKAGTYAYYVNASDTSIPKNSASSQNLPANLTGSDIFIINMCIVDEDSYVTNVYVLFDESVIYIGKTFVGSTTTVSAWKKLKGSEPSDFIQEMTTSQYNTLTNAVKNNGVLYLLTDGDSDILKMESIIDVADIKGESTLSKLPSAPSTHDFYFITDTNEGRYYDGSVWKVVK